MAEQTWRSWTCGVCNQALTFGMQRCPRCRTPVSPPDHAPYGRDGILGDALPGYVAPVPPDEPSAQPPPATRRRLVAIGIIAAVVVALFGVVWATSGDGPEPRRRPTTTSVGPTTGPTSTRPGTTGTIGPPTTFTGLPPSSGPSTSTPTSGPQTSGVPPSSGPTTSAPPLPQVTERWNVHLGKMAGTAAVNGTQVVVATRSGTVVSLDAHTGKVRWRRALGQETPNGVLVHRGMVITRTESVASAAGDIVAIDGRNGRIRWRHRIDSVTSIFDRPAAVGDGRVYALSKGLVAFDVASGRQLWKGSDGFVEITHAPVFGAGRVAVSDYEGTLRAYDAASGAFRWRTKVGRGTPVARGDLMLVQSLLPDLSLYAVDATSGKVRWRIASDGTSFAPATRIANTIVVPKSRDLIAVSSADGSTRWIATGVPPGAAVSAAGSTVYATSYKLWLIEGGSGQVRAEGELSDVSIYPSVPAGDTTVVIMVNSVGGYR